MVKFNKMSLSESMEPGSQQYCLRWKYHHSNLQIMFAQLLERECFCDVTLACEGRTLRAHKMVLSACSTYFDSIFSVHEEKDPIVILKDVKFNDIKALVEFMYKGEINVENSQLNTLLHTAEELKIKGLAAVSWRARGNGEWRIVECDKSMSSQTSAVISRALPQKKRKLASEHLDNAKNMSLVTCHPATSTERGMAGSGDDDSQAEMWDAKSPDEGSYLSEDSRHASIDSTVNNMCISTVVEGEGSVNTEAEHPEFRDVMKMTTYIQQGGRRPQFWETPTTKRVLDAIKTKKIEMKMAAQLLGVSYGTLYGRYREVYGCLKQPYRVREFWLEPITVDVVRKLQRKEMSLFKAAELLNVTVTTLANYLATIGKIEAPDDQYDLDITSAVTSIGEKPDSGLRIKHEPPDQETSS